MITEEADFAQYNGNKDIPITAQHEEAFEKFVSAIAPDMPLLMHGAGDVILPAIDHESAALLARYTAEYVTKLTTAAVDAHEILTDGTGHQYLTAAPAYVHKPSIPMSYAEEIRLTKKSENGKSEEKSSNNTSTNNSTSNNNSSNSGGSANNNNNASKINDDTAALKKKFKKRKIPGEEYWDDPLPPIKIKAKKDNGNKNSEETSSKTEENDDDETTNTATATDAEYSWMGCQGIDLQRDLRIRKRHVQQAIGTPSFTFPICHDAELYERTSHLQTKKLEVREVLENSQFLDFIKTEAVAGAKKSKEDKQKNDDNDANAAAQAEEETSAVEWPGLDSILPIHKFLS